MKHGKTTWTSALLLALCASIAAGAYVYPLTEQEKADTGANYMVKITHADLTEASTNTAQTITNVLAVAAKQGVELVAMVLKTPFTDDATNAFASVALTVGDGTDTDLYLDSTELNSYGAEVYLKYGRTGFNGAATLAFVTNVADTTGAFVTNVTDTTGTFMTNVTLTTATLIYDSGAYTQEVVTGVTVLTADAVTATTAGTGDAVTATTASTSSGLVATGVGRKLYTSSDTVDFIFTPSASYGLSALDNGEVWLYFHIWDAAK
jgi:hypothetical protein